MVHHSIESQRGGWIEIPGRRNLRDRVTQLWAKLATRDPDLTELVDELVDEAETLGNAS
jgi:hypothetical protein